MSGIDTPGSGFSKQDEGEHEFTFEYCNSLTFGSINQTRNGMTRRKSWTSMQNSLTSTFESIISISEVRYSQDVRHVAMNVRKLSWLMF